MDASEHYAINNQGLSYNGVDALAASLKAAAAGQADPTIVIDADAKATHQSVINIMEAARRAGYSDASPSPRRTSRNSGSPTCTGCKTTGIDFPACTLILYPVSLVFRALVALRRELYLSSFLPSHQLLLPVIVIGNISVGGTGKTPLTLAWRNNSSSAAGIRSSSAAVMAAPSPVRRRQVRPAPRHKSGMNRC